MYMYIMIIKTYKCITSILLHASKLLTDPSWHKISLLLMVMHTHHLLCLFFALLLLAFISLLGRCLLPPLLLLSLSIELLKQALGILESCLFTGLLGLKKGKGGGGKGAWFMKSWFFGSKSKA